MNGGASAIDGAAPVTLELRAAPPTLDVHQIGPRRLQTFYDPSCDRAVYLWGCVSHPNNLRGDPLLRWCNQVCADCPESLRQLLGNFVLIIDDRRQQRVSFVSDILAVRPWFVAAHRGRLVAGSDVLSLCDFGLTGGGQVNYDAVGSWLLYNFDCTGGSVAQDYRRLPPATIWTFDPAGRRVSETCYAPVRYVRDIIPTEELVDALHAMMSRKFDEILSFDDVREVSLPLSGGYDSRYLLALAAQRGRPRAHAVTVATTPREVPPAKQVADILNLPLRILASDCHVLDLFDDPFAFGGDGFPLGRHLSAAIARLHPGMPLLSGFLGDVFMRAPVNPSVKRFAALDDQPLSDEQYADAAHHRFRIATNRLDLLREPIAQHAFDRARAGLIRAIRQGRPSTRPLAHTNLKYRFPLHYGGVFLGHLDSAETIMPFYNWELIDFNVRHNGSFSADVYPMLFRKYFPALAHVPHDTQINRSPAGQSSRNGASVAVLKKRRPTRHLRSWSSDLLRSLLWPGDAHESAITPHKLLARLPAGLVADGSDQIELMFLHKIHLFEQRIRRANLKLDWSTM